MYLNMHHTKKPKPQKFRVGSIFTLLWNIIFQCIQVYDMQLDITVAMYLPSNGHFWLGRVETHCLGLIAHWEGWNTLPVTSHNHLERNEEGPRAISILSMPCNVHLWIVEFFMKSWTHYRKPSCVPNSSIVHYAFWCAKVRIFYVCQVASQAIAFTERGRVWSRCNHWVVSTAETWCDQSDPCSS